MKKTLLFIGLIAGFSIYAQNPTVLNDQFLSQAKSSGGDAASAAWINKSIADQGETGSLVLPNTSIKFDDNESDGMYQEIAVLQNTSYKLTYLYQFKDGGLGGTEPSELEIRILKGSGYTSGYSVVYYTTVVSVPQDEFGYTNITDVENSANNLASHSLVAPIDQEWYTGELTFNSGTETSIAIFGRGTGRPTTVSADTKANQYAWSNGKHEIRIDYLSLTNESTASVKENFATNFSLYPNPSKGFINIQSKNVEISKVQLFTVTGQKVLDQKGLVNGGIDVSKFAKGIYVLKIESGDKFYTNKVIVE